MIECCGCGRPVWDCTCVYAGSGDEAAEEWMNDLRALMLMTRLVREARERGEIDVEERDHCLAFLKQTRRTPD